MFIEIHRDIGGMEVRMIGGRDGDGIDRFVHLVEHFSVIRKFGSAIEFREIFPSAHGIYVTHGDNIFALEAIVLEVALPSEANKCDVNLLIGIAGFGNGGAGNAKRSSGFDKTAACHVFGYASAHNESI
jgi:hypothetical protein